MSGWSWLFRLIDVTPFGLVYNFPIGFCWKQMMYPGQESRKMGFFQSAWDNGQTGAAGFKFTCPWPWSRTVEFGGGFAVTILGRCWIQLLCVETPLRRGFHIPRGWWMFALPSRYPTSQLRGPNPMLLSWFMFEWCFSGNLSEQNKRVGVEAPVTIPLGTNLF